MAGSSAIYWSSVQGHPCGNRRTDRLRKNSFHPWSACRPYREVFRHIVVLCPTVRHNKTYHQRHWIWTNPEVYVVDPGERLHDYLRAFYLVFQGEPTLYVIDDCSATKALTKKKNLMLSELAFSGRHAKQSVWVLHKNTTLSWKTCASRRAGSPSSTVKIVTHSKTVCVKMTWSPLKKSGHWCGSSKPRQNMLNFYWRRISLLLIWCVSNV